MKSTKKKRKGKEEKEGYGKVKKGDVQTCQRSASQKESTNITKTTPKCKRFKPSLTYQSTVVNDGIRFLGDPVPRLLAQTKLLVSQITDDTFDPSLLDPLLIPNRSTLTTLPQPLESLFGRLGPDKTDDFGDALGTPSSDEKVSKDESTKETRGAREEDGERLGGEVRGER